MAKKSKSKNSKKLQEARERWDRYFGAGELVDFQRLCADLKIEGDLSSKNKCRKALEGVFVNVCQFLDAMGVSVQPPSMTDPRKQGTKGGDNSKLPDIVFFKNLSSLRDYTNETKSFFPRRDIPRGSPLKRLLREVLYQRRGKPLLV